MNVLVTGGGGFLGLEVCKKLIEKDFLVTSISRKKYKELEDLNITQIECDLSDQNDINNISLIGFDIIVHTAAKAGVWGSRNEFFSANLHGTINIFNKAKLDGVKYFIYTSSPSVVFGEKDLINEDENLAYPLKYHTYYAHSKALAENYILSNVDEEIKAIALRPHLIWGKNDPHLIPRIIQKSKKNRLVKVGDGQNLVDVIYVENAAMAHVNAINALIEKPQLSGQAYFIGQEKPINLWSFIDRILAAHQLSPVKKQISFKAAFYIGQLFEFVYPFINIFFKAEPPMTKFMALQLAKSHYFSHEKARVDLNYKPDISFEDAFKKTFGSL